MTIWTWTNIRQTVISYWQVRTILVPAVLYLFFIATIVTAINCYPATKRSKKNRIVTGFTYDAQIQRYVKMAELYIDDSDNIVQKDKKFMRETCLVQNSFQRRLFSITYITALSFWAANLTFSSCPIFKSSQKLKKSVTKGVEVLDAASAFIKQFQSARCSYIFMKLAIPDFQDWQIIIWNTGFIQELMETPNECLVTQLPKNRLRLFMHLLTIMLKKMRLCFLEGSRDLKMKRLDFCLHWKQRWVFGGSTRKLVVF